MYSGNIVLNVHIRTYLQEVAILKNFPTMQRGAANTQKFWITAENPTFVIQIQNFKIKIYYKTKHIISP
jgi:hypothetical protein